MTPTTWQIFAHRLWANREARCLSIIEHALLLLRSGKDLPRTEVELNRRLFFCLLSASRALYPDDEIAPIMECNNQPDPDDDARTRREQKRPDFQWVYLDRYEPNPERSSKQYVVECKRLGDAPRADWVLTLNYADHGVRRFSDPVWAYAKGAQSGAMIGYWQSMEPNEILDEVNSACRAHALPELVLAGTWGIQSLSRLDHAFDRPFQLSPFKLIHIWIDLRHASSGDA